MAQVANRHMTGTYSALLVTTDDTPGSSSEGTTSPERRTYHGELRLTSRLTDTARVDLLRIPLQYDGNTFAYDLLNAYQAFSNAHKPGRSPLREKRAGDVFPPGKQEPLEVIVRHVLAEITAALPTQHPAEKLDPQGRRLAGYARYFSPDVRDSLYAPNATGYYFQGTINLAPVAFGRPAKRHVDKRQLSFGAAMHLGKLEKKQRGASKGQRQ
jgi:hypothetical protein